MKIVYKIMFLNAGGDITSSSYPHSYATAQRITRRVNATGDGSMRAKCVRMPDYSA